MIAGLIYKILITRKQTVFRAHRSEYREDFGHQCGWNLDERESFHRAIAARVPNLTGICTRLVAVGNQKGCIRARLHRLRKKA